MKHLFILVPSLQPTGPVKGAIALANSLADIRPITLVYLKHGPTGKDLPLDRRVHIVSLTHEKSYLRKFRRYRSLLLNAGGREHVASVSFCFSADMVNLFCRRQAVTGSSIRGNLLQNYRETYGLLGIPLAITHLVAMRRFDHVVSMSSAMAKQVHFYTSRHPAIIGNFVDEAMLEPYRRTIPNKGPLRFIFLGSLTPRKRPMALLNAIYELYKKKVDVHLDIVGEGPMKKQLEAGIARLGLGDLVALHGHLSVPYHLVSQSDVLVLPSSSEGIARASLEALHLGIPCVLRNIDGNNELIFTGVNGALFDRDVELVDAMQRVAEWSRNRETIDKSLLPPAFRQYFAARQYIALMESKA